MAAEIAPSVRFSDLIPHPNFSPDQARDIARNREKLILEQNLPELIQGGMGLGVSNWKLARKVAIAGIEQDKRVLGVVSGAALPTLMAMRLQDGDTDMIRALEEFDKRTQKGIGKRIVDQYYKPATEELSEKEYILPPKPLNIVLNMNRQQELTELGVASAFAEVWLAKEGLFDKEGRPVQIGINVLEKIQPLHLATMLGAMIAGVDYVLVGAGIPRQFPNMLKDFSNKSTASYKVHVEKLKNQKSGEKDSDPDSKTDKKNTKVEDFDVTLTLDPNEFITKDYELRRPKAIGIIAIDSLTRPLAEARDSEGNITREGFDGYYVEGPTAGGHNLNNRSKEVDEFGRPIYTKKDVADYDFMRELGKPWWLAGEYGTPEMFEEAKKFGAIGVGVGTDFAYSSDSGILEKYKEQVIDKVCDGTIKVLSNRRISPTDFTFEVVQDLPGTLAMKETFDERKAARIPCQHGYLVTYAVPADAVKGSVKIIEMCPGEPIEIYKAKGGTDEDSAGRCCLCEALKAVVMPRSKNAALLTSGQNTDGLKELIERYGKNFTPANVVEYIFSLSPHLED